MNMKLKDRAIECEAPIIGVSFSSRLMLKAHAIDDCAHVAQTASRDQQHQVENALAIATGHSCASDVLNFDTGQGAL